MHLTKDRQRIRVAGPPTVPDPPPQVGEIAETIRGLFAKEYGAVPPDLTTQVNEDGSATVQARVPETDMDVTVTIKMNQGGIPAQGQGAPAAQPGAPAQAPQAPAQAPPAQPGAPAPVEPAPTGP